MRKTIFGLLVMAALAPAAFAEVPDATVAVATGAGKEEVHVAGMRDPDFKPYRVMLLGLDAFDKHHGRAPKADLRFILRPQVAGADIKGVLLRIADDESSLPIPVGEDGTFALARGLAVDKSAELLTNRKKGAIRWRPYIMSPGVAAGSRRLGDLRLECAVRWAVEREDMSFVKRNLLSALGACNSKRIFVIYYADGPLAGATLREGARTMELAKPGSQSYSPPLFDESWSDDALIELRYEPPKS